MMQYLQDPNQPPPGWQPPAPPQPHRKPRRWLPWAAGVGAFILGVVIGAAPSSNSADTTAATSTPTVTQTVPGPAATTVPGPAKTVPGPTVTKTVPGPARTVTAPPPAPKAAITEDGVFLVGTDIKPGTYRSGPDGDCYWARLKNTNGDLDSIIANNNGGNQVVTIRSTDKAFETARCGTWTRIR